MTGVFSIDIMTMIFGLILPFWVALSICIALAIGRRLNTFMVGSYVRDVIDENNRLIMEKRSYKKMINFEVELPSDDFYLQWIHIYLWQLKFNVAMQMEKELKRLGVRE